MVGFTKSLVYLLPLMSPTSPCICQDNCIGDCNSVKYTSLTWYCTSDCFRLVWSDRFTGWDLDRTKILLPKPAICNYGTVFHKVNGFVVDTSRLVEFDP